MKIQMLYVVVAFCFFALPLTAQVDGTGTAGRVPVWLDSNTLGNSKIVQSSGTIGIPTSVTIRGPNGPSGTTLNAPTAFLAQGGTGGMSGPFQLAGTGGAIKLFGGFGGGTRGGIAGDGGSVLIAGGSGRRFGNVLLASTGGRVGIGTTSPLATFDVATGKSTLADAWTTRSSLRFKTNIRPLTGALQKIEQLKGVAYERKTDGKQEVGLVAEDVNRVVPEVVSSDPVTHEVQGMDYSRLTALLIEAVKSQQAELQSQKAEIEQLKSQLERVKPNSARQ